MVTLEKESMRNRATEEENVRVGTHAVETEEVNSCVVLCCDFCVTIRSESLLCNKV